jgi:hypothetical protein
MNLPTARKSETENPKGAAISLYPPMIGENASKIVAKAAAQMRYEADWSRIEPMFALVLGRILSRKRAQLATENRGN